MKWASQKSMFDYLKISKTQQHIKFDALPLSGCIYIVHLLTVKAVIKSVKSPVLPYNGGSTFVMIYTVLCIGIQQVSSRLGLKGFVCYICASLFFRSKRKHLSNQEKWFLFHFKSSFTSGEKQILEFYLFKFHDVIKCLSIKQEIHFTE